jgi:hypothetical protein
MIWLESAQDFERPVPMMAIAIDGRIPVEARRARWRQTRPMYRQRLSLASTPRPASRLIQVLLPGRLPHELVFIGRDIGRSTFVDQVKEYGNIGRRLRVITAWRFPFLKPLRV